jgi:transposase
MRVQSYDPQFIRDAVDLLERSSSLLPTVAKSLGVPESTLRYWYKTRDMPKKKRGRPREDRSALAAAPGSAVVQPESATEKLERLERENRALRRENEALKTDREILKKAAAFFAKESE